MNWSMTGMKHDVLLIQSGDKKHYGYELKVVSVQLLDAETAKIVVYFNRTNDVGTEDAEPARAFIRVDRGVLQFKKFIVENGRWKQSFHPIREMELTLPVFF